MATNECDEITLLKSKQKASVLWLLSKAYNNDIPTDLKEPYYKDHDDHDRVKPQITHTLANAELYCLALANIYSDPNYHCLNHHGIIQILMRKGIFLAEPHDTLLTETVLVQTAPIKMSAHMVIIEAIMALYIKEVLIPEKVVEVVSRFIDVELPEDMPDDAEDAALFWIKKSCVKLKQLMQIELNAVEDTRDEPTPHLPILEDFTDMSDGCCLAGLLSFYCPDHLRWQQICLNKDITIEDAIYNLQLVQFFCQEKLPYNVCFLSIEDFLYFHETIRSNVMAFIADLLFLFEIRPAACVRQPLMHDETDPGDDETDRVHPVNGVSLTYPNLPTPAEMKMKSLQHSSWSDERDLRDKITPVVKNSEHRNGSTPHRIVKKDLSRDLLKSRSSHKKSSASDDDEELTRYFSALEIKPDFDASPEILMINDRKSPHKSGPQSISTYSSSNRHSDKDLSPHNDDIYKLSSSPVKNSEHYSQNNSQLEDYYTHLGTPNSSPTKKSTPNTTSFAKLNSENAKNLAVNSSTGPAINIAYTQKSDKHERDHRAQMSPKKSDYAAGVPTNMEAPISARAIPHINKSDTVKQLLELEYHDDSPRRVNDKQLINNNSDNEIASQVRNIRLILEEKRRKIEHDRLKAEDQWKSLRQDIGKEAFLRVVSKTGRDDDNDNAFDDEKNKSEVSVHPNNKVSVLQEKRGNVTITNVAHDIDSIKRKWFDANTPVDENKPFLLNSTDDRTNIDDLRASINQMETSITDIDADLEKLEEHEEMLKGQNSNKPNDESKFFLHSTNETQQTQQYPMAHASQPLLQSQTQPPQTVQMQQPQQHYQQLPQPPQNQIMQMQPQRNNMWNDQFNDMQQTLGGPRRGQWGQPVMPITSNSGINQWSTVPMQRASDPTYNSGYDIQTQRPYNQPFQDNYGYNAGPYSSMNQFPAPVFPNQNGAPMAPQQQFPYQSYPQSQFGPNNVGQYNPVPPPFNLNISYPPVPSQQQQMLQHNSDQSFHSLSMNAYPSQPINIAQEQVQQMRQLQSQPTRVPSNTGGPSAQQYDDNLGLVSSSPTNKPGIGRTFRVSKSKVHSSDSVDNESPTRGSTVNDLPNDGESNGKEEITANGSSRDEFGSGPTEAFFISFDNSNKSRNKPPIKPKPLKLQNEQKANDKSSVNISNHEISQKNDSISSLTSPGVGYVIGEDLVSPDPQSELEMAKKKELRMIQSLKRRAEGEAKRIAKEHEIAQKREEERIKRDLQERKREEEKIKKQMILEQYKQRKIMEEMDKDITSNSSGFSSKDSPKNNSTLFLNRQSRQRPNSGGKPRPKSLHVSASNIQDYTSLDCKPLRTMDDIDGSYSNLMSSSNVNSSAASRPQSAMSGHSNLSAYSSGPASKRLPSPNQSQSHLPSLPPFSLGRNRGPPSDCASDFGSTFSEYNGPKLFVKPNQKSNKILVLNAVNVVLAGAVNNETKKRVIEEINTSDSKHYLIMFRNAGLQFRAIYSYNPDREEVFKLYGVGPKFVSNEMIDKFYKYNSGSKSFSEIQTKHLSVTIDAFIIHNNLWAGKKIIPKKDYL